MAVFKHKCAGREVKINNVDHLPPHCHVLGEGENIRVALATLTPFHPPGAKLASAVRKCLASLQVEMVNAWQRVTVTDTGIQED